MSAYLLAAALDCDDGVISTDCEAATCDAKAEQPLQDAMSHTATEEMHAASVEAISHKSNRHPQSGGKKKGSTDLQMLVSRRKSAGSIWYLSQHQGLTTCCNACLLMESAFRCGHSFCTEH